MKMMMMMMMMIMMTIRKVRETLPLKMIQYFGFLKRHAFDSAVSRYKRKKEKRTSTVAYMISPSCNSNSGLGLTIT